MEGEPGLDSPTRPTLRLQASNFPGFTAPSLSPSSKLDEGYSDDTRSQSDKDLVLDNVMMLPEWVLAQSETDRAGKVPPRVSRCLPQHHHPQPPLTLPPANQCNLLNFRTRIQPASVSFHDRPRCGG